MNRVSQFLRNKYRSYLFEKYFALSRSETQRLCLASGVSDWHFKEMDEYSHREIKKIAMPLVAKFAKNGGRVHESGCGIGANLFYLFKLGITELSGSDTDELAIEVAKKIGGKNISFSVSDGAHVPTGKDIQCFIALNWLYFVPSFDLQNWILKIKESLANNGHMVFDLADKDFETHPLSKFNVNDWHLPEEERRPSQYLVRHSRGEISLLAESCGMKVVHLLSAPSRFPRLIVVLMKDHSHSETLPLLRPASPVT